jgi:hypothetical protein
MNNLPVTRTVGSSDIIQQASQFVVAVLFPKSKSAVYPLALNLARSASMYQELELDGHMFHVAFFAADIDSMKRALSLINFACRITHAQIYGRGQLIRNSFKAISVIECYINSLKPDNYKAHCFVLKRCRIFGEQNLLTGPIGSVPDIDIVDIEVRVDGGVPIDEGPYGATSFIIPCAYLTRFADFKLLSVIPASFVDQIRSAGAEHGCDWCPNFRPDEFQKL